MHLTASLRCRSASLTCCRQTVCTLCSPPSPFRARRSRARHCLLHSISRASEYMHPPDPILTHTATLTLNGTSSLSQAASARRRSIRSRSYVRGPPCLGSSNLPRGCIWYAHYRQTPNGSCAAHLYTNVSRVWHECHLTTHSSPSEDNGCN